MKKQSQYKNMKHLNWVLGFKDFFSNEFWWFILIAQNHMIILYKY